MTTIAELGIRVDSGDAVQAATDLEKMTKAGERAEQSAVGLMNEMQALEKSLSAGAKTTQELAKQRESLARLTKTGAYGEAEFLKISTQLDKQQQALVKSTMDEQRALVSLMGSIDPAQAALAKLDKQVEDLGKHLDAGRISQVQYNEALKKIDGKYAEIEKTGSAFSSLGLNTKAARQNVVQLGNALADGNFKVAAHNVFELGANAGTSAIRIAALAAPIGLAVAAAGSLAYGFIQGRKETDSYNKSLILTGNYAGVSAGQLGDMARQVSATVGTTGQAAAVLATLAGSGKIAGESFTGITQAAVSMQEATGKAVSETVSEFEKIAKDPVAAAKELNDQYHFLTASVYSQIVALKEQGDTVGAVKLLTDTYAGAVETRAGEIIQNLGLIERGWNFVRDAAKEALDATLSVGRQLTLEQQAQEIRERLANNKGRGGRAAALGIETRNTAEDQKQLDSLEMYIEIEKRQTKYAGERRKSQQAAVTAMEKVDALTKSSWTNEQKRTDALKEYKKQLDDIRKENPNDSRLNQAAIDKNISNINAKFKDPKEPGTQVDLTGFNDSKNSLTSILSEYKNYQKELDAALKAGIISQESYASQREAIIEQQKGEVTGAYETEIAALEAVKGKASTSAAQRIQLDQKIADARVNMVKAQKDADSELAVLATNEEGRLRKQALAVQTYTSALEQQVSTLRLQGQRSAEGLGLGDRQRSLQDQQNSIADRTNQQKLDLANQYGDGSRGMSLDEYNQKLAALDKTQRDLQETAVANYDDMTAAQGSWSAGASSAFQNYLESARDVAGQTKALFGNAFSSMEDAVANFAISGKFSFSNFTKSVLADMARIATRQAASGLLSSIAGSALGSWFSGAGGATASAGSTQAGYGPQFMDNFVSGQRAAGGPVAANSLYEVNELGPELLNQGGKTYLMMGAEGGSITPLGAGPTSTAAAASGSGAGTGQKMEITININREGGGDVSADTAMGQRLAPQFLELIRAEIAANERKTLSPSGGATWRAIQGRR